MKLAPDGTQGYTPVPCDLPVPDAFADRTDSAWTDNGYSPLSNVPLRTRIVGAKMLTALQHDARIKVGVEKGSVYGAAILMPQLGRTLGWPRDFISLAFSAYIYLFFCYFLLGAVLTFIAKEEKVLNMFAGQMFLCDFGAHMDSSETPHTGPGGTEMTPPRLYDWSEWSTRTYVKVALNALFPDRDDIDRLVDPGEYGVESYWCRLLCVHIFVISIIQEFFLTIRMWRLMFLIPSVDEPWLENKEGVTPTEDVDNWLDEVTVRVNGMPLRWKFINILLVCLPKTYLLLLTAVSGTNYLMETSSIDGIITNSVALGFLLSFDELVTQSLMSVQANALLEMCDDYAVDPKELITEEVALKKLEEQMSSTWLVLFDIIWNKMFKLTICVVFTWVLVAFYYEEHCELVRGHWVSKAMYVPTSLSFSVKNAFLFIDHFYPVTVETEPYWIFSDG